MRKKALKKGLFLRPHFKTHQSVCIGNFFRKYGINAITVSSVSMAEYFKRKGWDDITIAFPVNVRETDKINLLSKNSEINLLTENLEAVRHLKKKLKNKVGIFIKIDTGYHRTGVNYGNIELIKKIIKEIKNSNLYFKGFLTHSGHTYYAKSKKEIININDDTNRKLNLLKKLFFKDYPNIILSTGDTPSCATAENFEGIDEIRPGNFVFYDVKMLSLGICKEKNIAVCLACPVAAKHKSRNEIIIYGGSIHLSKDYITNSSGTNSYGLIVKLYNKGWSKSYRNCFVKSLSQEHGILKVSKKLFNELNIGDLIGILPVHSCLTANAMKGYYTFEGSFIDHM